MKFVEGGDISAAETTEIFEDMRVVELETKLNDFQHKSCSEILRFAQDDLLSQATSPSSRNDIKKSLNLGKKVGSVLSVG